MEEMGNLIEVCRDPIEIRVLVEHVHVPHISIERFYLLCPWLSQGFEQSIAVVHLDDEEELRQKTKLVTEVEKVVVDEVEEVAHKSSSNY